MLPSQALRRGLRLRRSLGLSVDSTSDILPSLFSQTLQNSQTGSSDCPNEPNSCGPPPWRNLDSSLGSRWYGSFVSGENGGILTRKNGQGFGNPYARASNTGCSSLLEFPQSGNYRTPQFSPLYSANLRSFSGQPLPVENDERKAGSTVKGDDAGVAEASPEDLAKAVDSYDKLLDKLEQRSYPPTYKPWHKRVNSAAKAVRVFLTVYVFGFPGILWRALTAPSEAKGKWFKKQWKHIKEGAGHYWVGTKLLATDIRIASRLLFKTVSGRELTRREHKQLMRTVADLFRLVPMIIFLVVPFLEFLLPVALKLFPKMLPSTFEDKLKRQEELKKRLAVKLEVARFLQDTVAVMARDLRKKKTGATQASAAELYQFMKDVRGGKAVDNSDITRFAPLFNDEITLDKLERVHLVSMCQFVGLSPFGTDSFLRSRLRAHLGGLKRDDQVIRSEGLENMTEEELRSACRARGMRTPFGQGAKEFMKKQMEEWLELSLERAFPSSLLLLSRAFTVTLPIRDPQKKKQLQMDNLKNTLSTLPDETLDDIHMEVLKDATADDNARKLEYIRREEELIREEEKEAAERAMQEEILPDTQEAQPSAVSARAMAATTTAAAVLQAAEAQLVKDALISGSEESEEEKASKLAAAREQKLKKVLSALAILASSSGVSNERTKFMELVKHEIGRIQEEMATKGGASLQFTGRGLEAWRPAELDELPEENVSKKLSGRVSQFLHNIEKELDDVDKQVGESMHLIDLDGDGMISTEELQTALGFLKDQLGEPELRHLLEELCKSAEKGTKIDVKQLMALANKRLESDTQ